MRKHQIEAWALRVIDCVEQGQPNEDSMVELKAQWPDAQKAARLIAGHANAARGEPILWLIGVDQTNGVKGAAHAELAEWYSKVKSQFDGLAPGVTDVNVPINGTTVVALLFETDRAPFVVKNLVHGQPGGGPVSLEVPWRENTSTRSANRSELIRLLSPLQNLPSFEVLHGELSVREDVLANKSNEKIMTWRLKLELYASSTFETQIVIPFHQCSVLFEIPQNFERTPFQNILIEPDGNEVLVESSDDYLSRFSMSKRTFKSLVPNLDRTESEVLIRGSGKLFLKGSVVTELLKDIPSLPIHISAQLHPIHAERSVFINVSLSPTPKKIDELARWML